MVIEECCSSQIMLKSYAKIPSSQRVVASRAIIYPRHIISLRIGHDHRNDRSRSPEYADITTKPQKLPFALSQSAMLEDVDLDWCVVP